MSGSIQHILLDIEGTTCPVSFVSEVLFPYALASLPSYLLNHRDNPRLQELQQELLNHWRDEQDPEAQVLWHDALSRVQSSHPDDLLPYLHWLNRRDLKLTAWKELQGLIWRKGYSCGDLKAPLFPEVGNCLRRWHQQGRVLSVYSSGSVAAQQLLYGHSHAGDLTPLFSHWFDTRIGLKQETQSYRHILMELRAKPDTVLFISDSLSELRAAAPLGIHCWLSERSDSPSSSACSSTTSEKHGFPCLNRLDAVDPLLSTTGI
ncbi:MAG: acireductone synthase [Synechococcaceae cyanobacterium]|nr:acireductone synthase [Synechococcaceae cyanobacterium]